MNEFASDRLHEEPPFDLKAILRGTEFSGEKYADFQSRTDNSSQVLKDLSDAGKEYGKGETGKQYATMKLLSMIADYKEKLSPVDAGLLDLQVIQFLDIVYPEILQNNYPHLDYWKQRIDFFRTKLEPVFQQNVEIGRKNVEIRNIEEGLNESSRNYFQESCSTNKVDLTFFRDEKNISKFMGKALQDVYNRPNTSPEGEVESEMYAAGAKPKVRTNLSGSYNVKNGQVILQRSDDYESQIRIRTDPSFSSIQEVKLNGKKYFFPFEPKYSLDVRVIVNDKDLDREQNDRKGLQKYFNRLYLLDITKVDIQNSDNIGYILAEESDTEVIIGNNENYDSEYTVLDNILKISIFKIDLLKFKPYPSFRYTPSVSNGTNTGITPEIETTTTPTPVSETTPTPTETTTSMESLTEAVGTATIHFATADYNTLFAQDSDEKTQVDAYIAQVKALLQQKPGAIKSIQLTGHVAWFHNTPPIDDEAMQASLQRAEAVKQYIQAQLPDIAITTLGKGAEEALAAHTQGKSQKGDKFKRVDISVEFNQ